jgi:hypothetical protein
MFKNKILNILLALGVVLFMPSVALAQTTTEDYLYEDTSIEWDTNWEYDWGDYSDSYSTGIYDMVAAGTIFSGILLVWIIVSSLIGLAMYVYTALAYMKIAQKLNHPNPWFAWIPILNIVLHFQLAGMSGWYTLLMLVPIANIVVYIIALMNICEKRGFEKLLGLLYLVPVANLILLGILAWKKEENTQTKTTPSVTE